MNIKLVLEWIIAGTLLTMGFVMGIFFENKDTWYLAIPGLFVLALFIVAAPYPEPKRGIRKRDEL